MIDGDGRPVCSEMWPGNTAEVTTLIPVIDRLRRRFDIARVCVVADRGMISAETMAELEAHPATRPTINMIRNFHPTCTRLSHYYSI